VLAVLGTVLIAVACAGTTPRTADDGPTETPAASTPSPSASPSVDTVLVPEVVGKSQPTARTVLRRQGFAFAVGKSRTSMDQPPGWVLAQHPDAFVYALPGETVTVDVALSSNQWGFNFGCCDQISNPPSSFCSVFKCVARFHGGTGVVEECGDGLYTKAGGTAKACEKHGGQWRLLLAPPA
jgi:hypothetical protein